MAERPRRVAGIVLCGGRSARMRRPKALLPWRGRPLVAHVVAVLRELADEVVAVTSADLELPPLPARVVVDRVPGLGPLGGIREGLHAIGSELALVTSTDAPFLSPSLARALLAPGATAACEVDGMVEPFPAVYARELAVTADALLADGRRRPLELLEAGGLRRIDGSPWAARGTFDGFNTPEEYLAAVAGGKDSEPVVIELFGALRRTAGRAQVETVAGTLKDVLGALGPELDLCAGGALSRRVRVVLDGWRAVDDLELPVGPGETLSVLEGDVEPRSRARRGSS